MSNSRCKYYKQKRQVSYNNGQTWEDVKPYEYQQGDLYETDSLDCGYVPLAYRWVKTDDTTCVEASSQEYRWVNIDLSVGYYCEGTTKYYKQKKQVSYDGRKTWEDVVPYEYQRGGIAETQSTDCGYYPYVYRWVNLDASVDYYCEGTTKMYKQQRQYSTDSGQTWHNVEPAEYREGDVAEIDSLDCGYIPPVTEYRWVKTNNTMCEETTDKKLYVTYSNGTTREVECNSSTYLSTGETIPSGYEITAMTSVFIGDCVHEIGYNTFWGCTSITSLTIPETVTSIGDSAFRKCTSLTSLRIPDSARYISDYAFSECSGLTSVILPSSLTSFSRFNFWRCTSLTSITIPNTVTSIDWAAFEGCGLTHLTIPNSVTSLSNQAFSGCSSLTTVEIGSGITSIGNSAFSDCRSLTSVTVNATTPPSISNMSGPFTRTNNCPIYVPAASVGAYKAAFGWSVYSGRIFPIT